MLFFNWCNRINVLKLSVIQFFLQKMRALKIDSFEGFLVGILNYKSHKYGKSNCSGNCLENGFCKNEKVFNRLKYKV